MVNIKRPAKVSYPRYSYRLYYFITTGWGTFAYKCGYVKQESNIWGILPYFLKLQLTVDFLLCKIGNQVKLVRATNNCTIEKIRSNPKRIIEEGAAINITSVNLKIDSDSQG